MSVARVQYVKHARQNYQRVAKQDEDGNAVRVPVTSKRTGEQKKGRYGPMTKRVTVIDRAQPLPNDKCGKCGDEIKPGDPYRWWTSGFRSHYKSVRCMKTTCTPRMSELESSDIRANIYAAQEDANDNLDGLDVASVENAGEVEEIVRQVGEAFREAADQLREADEAFGGNQATEHYERSEIAEQGADELEGWDTSGDSEPDFDECDDEVHLDPSERDDQDDDRDVLDRGDPECETCTQIRDAWFEALVEEARGAVDEVEVP